jgi:hypothetical protein
MFLRPTIRRKDGKEHRYWSLVENKRVSGGRVLPLHQAGSLLLDNLKLELPAQSPPKITAAATGSATPV